MDFIVKAGALTEFKRFMTAQDQLCTNNNLTYSFVLDVYFCK